jgi:anti-sigma factor RsiW
MSFAQGQGSSQALSDVREPSPPPKMNAPPRATTRKRRRGKVKFEPRPPMTLGNAAAARVRLVVWCKACRYQVEPDAAEQAQRYGAETPVLAWHARLVCSQCGGRGVDMMVTGERR